MSLKWWGTSADLNFPNIRSSSALFEFENTKKQKSKNNRIMKRKKQHTQPQKPISKKQLLKVRSCLINYSKEKMGSKKTCALHSIEAVYRGDLGQMNLMVKMTSRKSQGFVVKMPPKRRGRRRRVWAASAGKTC